MEYPINYYVNIAVSFCTLIFQWVVWSHKAFLAAEWNSGSCTERKHTGSLLHVHGFVVIPFLNFDLDVRWWQ